MSFGSRLDEAITMRGITQRKFAKMVGTSEVSISRYISGERNPKMPTAIKMADILNVSLDWLAIDESERKVGKKADVIEAYQKGWNDAIDAMQNAKFVSVADRKTESDSEKPNNCEHITEDGVTCAKYPACDDCLDNPLNKVKGSERLVKGSDESQPEPSGYKTKPVEDEPTSSKMEQVDKDINVRSKDEPQTDCTEALTLLWIKNMVTDEEFYRIDARLKVMPQTERSE